MKKYPILGDESQVRVFFYSVFRLCTIHSATEKGLRIESSVFYLHENRYTLILHILHPLSKFQDCRQVLLI